MVRSANNLLKALKRYSPIKIAPAFLIRVMTVNGSFVTISICSDAICLRHPYCIVHIVCDKDISIIIKGFLDDFFS